LTTSAVLGIFNICDVSGIGSIPVLHWFHRLIIYCNYILVAKVGIILRILVC
jgi:hypothetical protein